MTRTDRKNAVLRKTRLKFQQQIAAAGRPSARNYEALSKARYNSVRISNFGLKFLQYILNILYFRNKQKKNFNFFNPIYQTTTSIFNFLSGCTLKIRISDSLSARLSPEQGVPEGSPPSPLLYNIYCHNIYNFDLQDTTEIDKSNYLLQYADDTALIEQNRTLPAGTNYRNI